MVKGDVMSVEGRRKAPIHEAIIYLMVNVVVVQITSAAA